MGCPGCLLTELEKAKILEKVRKQAKEDAVKSQKIMVIYNLPDGGFSFMEIEAARNNNITPVQYISFLSEITNE